METRYTTTLLDELYKLDELSNFQLDELDKLCCIFAPLIFNRY